MLTPQDSLVFGGNFIHRYNIGLQLRYIFCRCIHTVNGARVTKSEQSFFCITFGCMRMGHEVTVQITVDFSICIFYVSTNSTVFTYVYAYVHVCVCVLIIHTLL